MSEYQHPSFDYEPTRTPEGTTFEDGDELDLHKSKHGTPEEGQARAIARIIEMTGGVERRPVYGHEEAFKSTGYVLAARDAELKGRQELFELAG